MKRIVYVLSALAIMLSVSNDLSAQQRGDRGQRGDRQGQGQGDRQGQGQNMSFSERQGRALKMMEDSLALSEDQVVKIKKLNKTYDTKFETMREEVMESGDRSAMRDKMQGLMETYNKDIKLLLTEDQKNKYDKLMTERRSRRSSDQGQRSRRTDGERSRGSRGSR